MGVGVECVCVCVWGGGGGGGGGGCLTSIWWRITQVQCISYLAPYTDLSHRGYFSV